MARPFVMIGLVAGAFPERSSAPRRSPRGPEAETSRLQQVLRGLPLGTSDSAGGRGRLGIRESGQGSAGGVVSASSSVCTAAVRTGRSGTRSGRRRRSR